MKEVYIVTSGEYSEYGIEGVFTDYETAEKFINSILNEHDARIETYGLNPYEKQIREGYSFYKVEIHKNGEIEELSKEHVWLCNDKECKFMYDPDNEVYILKIATWAKSEDHAAKIANEKRAQLVANNLWGTDKENLQ